MSGLEKPPSGWNKPPLGWSKPAHSRSSSTSSAKHSRQNVKDWEVMDDSYTEMTLGGDHPQDTTMPDICEDFLMKKRKWPLKGWHKRYFVLDKGILRYAKTKQDIAKGKLHGSLDVSLAVMSINKKSKRIDLDAGHSLYHIKTKSSDMFDIWVKELCAHRMHKKCEAVHAHNGLLQALSQGGNVLPSVLPGVASLAHRNRGIAEMASYSPYYGNTPHHQNEMPPRDEEPPTLPPGVNGKVSTWLHQSQQANSCYQELTRCQADLNELGQLVQKLLLMEGSNPLSNADLQRFISIQNLSLEKPKKKPGRIWGHSRTLSQPFRMINKSLSSSHSASHLGASAPSIPECVGSQVTPLSSTSPEGKKIQQDICNVSQRVHVSLKAVHEALAQDWQRLQEAWAAPDLHQSTTQQLATLCTTLSELEMQSRLTKVHSLSVSSDSTEDSFCTVRPDKPESSASSQVGVQRTPSLVSTYYDASDVMQDRPYPENEASDESGLSDGASTNSDLDDDCAHFTPVVGTLEYRTSMAHAPDLPRPVTKDTGYRTALPAPCPDNSHIGLMTILYNNIGKDLSRVSMPAALNEPLCLLQRLCEELEYSELLDVANSTQDPYQRMVYIAAFAISGYATARYRNRYKPFNPILGETYECEREDKGFRYVSEQVSHHPPVSACHAESKNFSFWQDQRWKNKFWGKSLEIMPAGMVNVTLPRFGDHYEWNKVVTCIHKVLSQQRFLEHYGEVTIRNLKSDVCTCKITFVKARYWGSDTNMNEVQGVVLDQSGTVVHRFGGYWHEGIYCDTLSTPQCIWKPNPQPKDHVLYYGFSSFAMRLNELTPDLKPWLNPTDTRLRPDQRLLEEGKVNESDKLKDKIEEKQREQRKILAKKGEEHIPRFFEKSLDAAGREVWLTNGTYWEIRENPGFSHTKNPDLWLPL
ncbi:oxysterol-binding protein-related protein 7 [Brienomyrus brachyistius]|uniref:oxysterol-binding protein-related protein 7 n=1 Tax=Brienomyrus brachyistius TaxID=42636 RepID=UPI0020B367DC|nr:oxysterol-binding protein-related protein 7 [Brienomyrus brachyistius]XP_048870136.1 oxysterol-binding protein-related protein 7 [Brienomyrus brachyistius]